MKNVITNETRRESNEKVDKQKWYFWIKQVLSEGVPMTAREVAIEIANRSVESK